VTRSTWRDDWRQFTRLDRGAGRRLLAGVTASQDSDPVPFAIWATALAMTPLLLTAIRSTLRLSMVGPADAEAIVAFIQVFRAFYVFYGMLLALLATAAIWDGLLPDRIDQEVIGALPVRPMVLAASRLAGATRIMLLLAASISVPVALTFGFSSGLQDGSGPLLRVVGAHLVTVVAAVMSVFWTLVAARATVVLIGHERTAERLAALLQVSALLLFVEAFIFLPGVMGTIVRALRPDSAAPFWAAPTLWFTALYGWLAEGGVRTAAVDRALAATVVPMIAAVALSLTPAAWLARRVHTSQPKERRSAITRIVRRLLAVRRSGTAVAGLTVFAAATISRNRRHALLLASYTGMAIAMATIQLLTAGFEDRFNISAPRQDVLAVPLVAIFFMVFALRAALEQPADALANWIFRIAPPRVADGRQAARLLVWLALVPVLATTGVTFTALWGPWLALKVLALDVSAGLLLSELAFARWTKVPCGSLHAAAGDTVKSRWPLLVLFLYLFAFRGADLQMYALVHGSVVWIVAAVEILIGLAVRRREQTRPAVQPTIDLEPDGPSLLHLSGSDA
jgi:hypothetical protein